MVILLLVSTSFVGVGNQVEELMVDNEEMEQPVQTGKGPMDSAWPTLCHDNRHTSRSPYSTSHITDLEKWRFQCDGGVDGGIVIDDDGILYFGDKHAYIYALFPKGTMKWVYETEGRITCAPSLAEDGTLYVGSWDRYLHAINSTNGKRTWRFFVDSVIGSSPIISDDGTIYTADANGRVYAINPDGTEKWRFVTQGSDIWGDIVLGDDGTLYIGTWNNYFFAINSNGTLMWKFKTGNHIKGPASIADDGTVYIGSWDDYLYALNPINGSMKWKIKVGAGIETNPSIAEDGTIYVGGSVLWAINPDGTEKWTFNLGNNRFIFKSDPAISADGTIYIGVHLGYPGYSDGGEILAVNPDGTEKWRKQISYESWVDSSPCIAEDGTIYIGSQENVAEGYVHAFGPVESNSPPEIPTITGPSKIFPLKEERFWISAIDPDNNPVSFKIDWGNKLIENEREHASGESFWIDHTWIRGSLIPFNIRVKAIDSLGEESDWAYFKVSMPHSFNYPFWWFNGLLDRFPFLERLLDFIAN
jgi:outer membrane protein assembly factor BamB